MKMIITGTIAAVSLGAVAMAASHSEENPAVKARNSHMQLYSFNLGTLGAMAKGEAEYDAEMAKAAAERLVALSGMSQVGYYPDGTSSEDIEDGRALPKLFTERAEYDKLTNDLNEVAMQMASVAGDGLEQVQANMKALGDACGACHEDYRKPKD